MNVNAGLNAETYHFLLFKCTTCKNILYIALTKITLFEINFLYITQTFRE